MRQGSTDGSVLHKQGSFCSDRQHPSESQAVWHMSVTNHSMDMVVQDPGSVKYTVFYC